MSFHRFQLFTGKLSSTQLDVFSCFQTFHSSVRYRAMLLSFRVRWIICGKRKTWKERGDDQRHRKNLQQCHVIQGRIQGNCWINEKQFFVRFLPFSKLYFDFVWWFVSQVAINSSSSEYSCDFFLLGSRLARLIDIHSTFDRSNPMTTRFRRFVRVIHLELSD